MKVKNRIIVGYAVLIGVVAALLVYQVTVLRGLQAVPGSGSGSDFDHTLATLQMLRDRDILEDRTRRVLAGAWAEDTAGLEEAQDNFRNRLLWLREVQASEREQAELTRLDQFYREFVEELARQQGTPQPDRTRRLPAALEESIDRLRLQSFSVYNAALQTLAAKADKSRTQARRAEFVLWCLVPLALLLSSLAAFFVVRSISVPLHHLKEGTRAMAEGKTYYRLDTSRTDEFSQIARDFNELTRRLEEN